MRVEIIGIKRVGVRDRVKMGVGENGGWNSRQNEVGAGKKSASGYTKLPSVHELHHLLVGPEATCRTCTLGTDQRDLS